MAESYRLQLLRADVSLKACSLADGLGVRHEFANLLALAANAH